MHSQSETIKNKLNLFFFKKLKINVTLTTDFNKLLIPSDENVCKTGILKEKELFRFSLSKYIHTYIHIDVYIRVYITHVYYIVYSNAYNYYAIYYIIHYYYII